MVKRYDPMIDGNGEMTETESGDYVLYSDYVALQERCEKAGRERDEDVAYLREDRKRLSEEMYKQVSEIISLRRELEEAREEIYELKNGVPIWK